MLQMKREIMKSKEIYDRTELCDEIISKVVDANETQAFILYSGIGRGKSSVSRKISKLIDERKMNKDVIHVKSAQDDNSQEGAFISNIFQSIRKNYLNNKSEKHKSKKNKYSYSRYIRHQNFWVIKKLIEGAEIDVEDIEKCKNIKASIIQFIKILIDFIGIKIGLIEELENNYTDAQIMISYIKYILKKENIVLCIENTQYFDKTSLDALTELLIETKDCTNFYIFEFTLTENVDNWEFLNKIKNELDYAEIVYNAFELKKLDFEYVLKLVKCLCDSVDKSFATKIEQMYTGNIKKVENFVFTYSVQTTSDADPTLELLHRLSNEQKYILAIILLNNSLIDEHVLTQILNNSNGIYLSNYNMDIEYLTNNVMLLEKRENNICIKDKDTVDSWNKNIDDFKKYETLAYKNCEDILTRILKNGVEYSLSRKDCILLLFQLYNKFDFIKLNSMLAYIDEIIYEIISIDELTKYLKGLINAVYIQEQSLNILYNIFDICNRHQLVELESLCLDKIEKIIPDATDEKYLFCYFTNLLQKESYKILLEQIEEKNCSFESSCFKYYVELFKIVANVSLNCTEECCQIIQALGNDLDFQKTVQYGYFLRLAEAYEKRNIAISKVEKSINIFNKFNMKIQVAKSQVSLSFLYAIIGNLEMAQEALDSAEKILLKNIENKHVFNINKACLCLLNHNYTEEVWNLLNESEKYAHIRFDKIAIIINKLIWCIENNDFGKGKYYEKKGLELLELEDNHHLHAIFFYNCYVLYKAMNAMAIAEKYLNLAVRDKEHCVTLKARLEGQKEVEDQTTFLLQYPWHVCFVSYWQFDYIFQESSL